MAKDLYQGVACAKIISRMGMTVALSLMMAPILGAWCSTYFGWKFISLIYALTSIALILMVTFFLKETRPLRVKKANDISDDIAEGDMLKGGLQNILSSYKELLLEPKYVGYVLMQMLNVYWLLGEINSLAFVFVHHLGVSKNHYASLTILCSLAYICGHIINQYALNYFKIDHIIRTGMFFIILGSVTIAILINVMHIDPSTLYVLRIIQNVGLGMVLGNTANQAVRLSKANFNSGSGSGLLSAGQLLAGSLGIITTAIMYINNDLTYIFLNTIIASTLALTIHFMITHLNSKSKKHIELT